MIKYKTKNSKILMKVSQIDALLDDEKEGKFEILDGLRKAISAKYDVLFNRLDTIYREEAMYIYSDRQVLAQRKDTILVDFYTHQEEQRRSKEFSKRQFCGGILPDMRADMIFTGEVLFEPDDYYKKLQDDLTILEKESRVFRKEMDKLLNTKYYEKKIKSDDLGVDFI